MNLLSNTQQNVTIDAGRGLYFYPLNLQYFKLCSTVPPKGPFGDLTVNFIFRDIAYKNCKLRHTNIVLHNPFLPIEKALKKNIIAPCTGQKSANGKAFLLFFSFQKSDFSHLAWVVKLKSGFLVFGLPACLFEAGVAIGAAGKMAVIKTHLFLMRYPPRLRCSSPVRRAVPPHANVPSAGKNVQGGAHLKT